MSGLDEKHLNCPSEDELTAYAKRELEGEQREVISLHLLFCDACARYLPQLSSSIPEQEESDREAEPSQSEVKMTPSLTSAVERFLARQADVKELAERPLDRVLKEDGLRVGQIWRTKTAGIVMPRKDGPEFLSVTQLDSAPHLVVITAHDSGTITHLDHQYHIIRVALVTADTEYADAGDISVPEAESPLGYELMIQLANEQRMLSDNLESCVGEFAADAHQSILAQLEQQGQKELNEGAFSLEAVVLKGLHSDPVMRYRAKEHEDTKYLRVPVEVLQETVDELERSTSRLGSVLRRLKDSLGEARQKLSLDLSPFLVPEPSFETRVDTIRYQSADGLSVIVIREEEDDTISVHVSSKNLELADREVILSAVGEGAEPIQMTRELKRFDEDWVSTEFKISKQQRSSISPASHFEVELK